MSTGVKYDPSAMTAPEAIRANGAELYAGYVNPQWARLLDVLQMNIGYARCSGDELETEDGRVILDFNSGYCVHNVGHNHPYVVAALKSELDRCGPAMLQAHVPDLAGELAARLCRLAGGRLTKAFFASSGSEGVEAAIKFARAHAHRAKILCARGGFHGLTCGALSLMSNDFWKKGFGPLLAGVDFVAFGKLEDLESKLATKSFAAFILEPIQGEGGVLVPSREYLAHAQDLCRRHGTLLVLDEVQTGMHRTGPFIAAQHFGIEPDMVILAKALSGGLIPSGAVLMSDAIYSSVYGSLRRALVHTSTFGENSLAMRAGLATLDILERENLGPSAASAGRHLRQALGERLAKYEMFGEVRGVGLLSGIEFKPPRSIKLRLAFEACAGIHPALFGQMIVMRMFRDHGILNQVCGNNFMVLKVSPPLTVENDRLDRYVDAIEQVMESVHGSGAFWAESLSIARRVIASI